MAALKLSNHGVVTSGDYERFVEHDGKRYHHILDPRTGYPATGCMSATVVAPNAELADALATALCVLPAKDGLKIINAMDKVDAMLVDLEGNIHRSDGLSQHVLLGKP